MYLCLLNQREEALVAGKGGKVRGLGKMVFRNLGSDNMLEKHGDSSLAIILRYIEIT